MKKSMEILPVCSYPTTVVSVDDNQAFVVNFQNAMFEAFHCRVSMDAQSMIDEINGRSHDVNWSKKVISSLDEEGEPSANLQLLTHKIHQRIFDKARFDEISVVFMDYRMPQNDGVFFLKQLRNREISRILFTGYPDGQLAIDAFNDGVIDHYLRKTNSLTLDENNVAMSVGIVHTMQERYFASLTRRLLENRERLLPLLANRNYINIMRQLIEKHNIVEFYLIDNHGSYLLVDKAGKGMILAAKSEDEAKGDEGSARYDGVAEDILSLLRSREQLLFFNDHIEPKDAANYLCPATGIPGTDHYYGIITNISAYGFDLSNIETYGHYLEKYNL